MTSGAQGATGPVQSNTLFLLCPFSCGSSVTSAGLRLLPHRGNEDNQIRLQKRGLQRRQVLRDA